jgi:hypothetical protein
MSESQRKLFSRDRVDRPLTLRQPNLNQQAAERLARWIVFGTSAPIDIDGSAALPHLSGKALADSAAALVSHSQLCRLSGSAVAIAGPVISSRSRASLLVGLCAVDQAAALSAKGQLSRLTGLAQTSVYFSQHSKGTLETFLGLATIETVANLSAQGDLGVMLSLATVQAAAFVDALDATEALIADFDSAILSTAFVTATPQLSPLVGGAAVASGGLLASASLIPLLGAVSAVTPGILVGQGHLHAFRGAAIAASRNEVIGKGTLSNLSGTGIIHSDSRISGQSSLNFLQGMSETLGPGETTILGGLRSLLGAITIQGSSTLTAHSRLSFGALSGAETVATATTQGMGKFMPLFGAGFISLPGASTRNMLPPLSGRGILLGAGSLLGMGEISLSGAARVQMPSEVAGLSRLNLSGFASSATPQDIAGAGQIEGLRGEIALDALRVTGYGFWRSFWGNAQVDAVATAQGVNSLAPWSGEAALFVMVVQGYGALQFLAIAVTDVPADLEGFGLLGPVRGEGRIRPKAGTSALKLRAEIVYRERLKAIVIRR